MVKERVVSSHKGPAIRTRIRLMSKAMTENTTPDNTSAKRFRTLRLHSKSGSEFNKGNISHTMRGVGAAVGDTLIKVSTNSACTVSRTVVRTSKAGSGSGLNTGTVLTISVTYTETTTSTLRVPLCHFLKKIGKGELPIPVVGVMGNKYRTLSSKLSIRRFVVVPIKTPSFGRYVH